VEAGGSFSFDFAKTDLSLLDDGSDFVGESSLIPLPPLGLWLVATSKSIGAESAEELGFGDLSRLAVDTKFADDLSLDFPRSTKVFASELADELGELRVFGFERDGALLALRSRLGLIAPLGVDVSTISASIAVLREVELDSIIISFVVDFEFPATTVFGLGGFEFDFALFAADIDDALADGAPLLRTLGLSPLTIGAGLDSASKPSDSAVDSVANCFTVKSEELVSNLS